MKVKCSFTSLWASELTPHPLYILGYEFIFYKNKITEWLKKLFFIAYYDTNFVLYLHTCYIFIDMHFTG